MIKCMFVILLSLAGIYANDLERAILERLGATGVYELEVIPEGLQMPLIAVVLQVGGQDPLIRANGERLGRFYKDEVELAEEHFPVLNVYKCDIKDEVKMVIFVTDYIIIFKDLESSHKELFKARFFMEVHSRVKSFYYTCVIK